MMTATVSRWARVRDSFLWYSFKRDKVAIISFIVLLAMVLSAIFAPLLAPTDPYDLAQIDIMNSELPPLGMSGADEAFPLGTDAQGRDMLSTILYGTQVSLMIGFWCGYSASRTGHFVWSVGRLHGRSGRRHSDAHR
ncbi:MAG: hypothetical protein MH219_14050 [Marinobacter sp.]|nr:hypothetical protein [Marinobacter sp.]